MDEKQINQLHILLKRGEPTEPLEYKYSNLPKTPITNIVVNTDDQSVCPLIKRSYNYYLKMCQLYSEAKDLNNWDQGRATVYGRESLSRMYNQMSYIYMILNNNKKNIITSNVFNKILCHFAKFRSYTFTSKKILTTCCILSNEMIGAAVEKSLLIETKMCKMTQQFTKIKHNNIIDNIVKIMIKDYIKTYDMWSEQHVIYADEYNLFINFYKSAIKHHKILTMLLEKDVEKDNSFNPIGILQNI